jgi:diaminopimelate decarboxylase
MAANRIRPTVTIAQNTVRAMDAVVAEAPRFPVVAFLGAGAYGAVMASDYNARPLAAEVLVDGDRFSVVKPRIEPAERFSHECLPEWLRTVSEERGKAS